METITETKKLNAAFFHLENEEKVLTEKVNELTSKIQQCNWADIINDKVAEKLMMIKLKLYFIDYLICSVKEDGTTLANFEELLKSEISQSTHELVGSSFDGEEGPWDNRLMPLTGTIYSNYYRWTIHFSKKLLRIIHKVS